MKLELFPCSGGMAEGFRRAGVVFDMAIDYDEDACNSYERNLGHRPIRMDVHDFARIVRDGWRPPGGIDLLVADPPCTPWSRAGKREGLSDDRDCLRVTAEIIALLRPRAYLIGNVPGLQDATQWHVVQQVIGGLREHGYCVLDYISLDAADYGVPQHRIRPFWFGHLDGPCIRWPEPTHGAPTTQVAIGGHDLLPWVTCRDALCKLPIGELGRPVRMRLREKGTDGRKNDGDRSRCSSPDAPAKTVVAKADRKGGQILIPGVPPPEETTAEPYVPNGGDGSVCSKPDAPARTIPAHEGIKGGGILIANEAHAPSVLDQPAKAVTGGRANRGVQGGRALLIQDDGHPTAKVGHSAPQVILEHPRHPISRMDEPAFVAKTNGGRAAGNGTMLKIPELVRDPNDTRKANFSTPDAPAMTLTRNTHSEGATLLVGAPDRAAGDGQGARIGDVDAPAPTVDAAGRGQHQVLEWPWDRPATTVCSRDTIPPPGHHPEAGSLLSLPNAVVLSEKAASILQGFPDHWVFSGRTKAARWGQIGMAMPPGLAEPVARSVVCQILATRVSGGGD